MRSGTVIEGCLGLAVLGVLLTNIAGHGSPAFSSTISATPEERHALYDSFCMAFVDGKFQALAAICLGWCIAPLGEAGLSRRGLSVLVAIGVLHGFLVWQGDMLATFGLTALLTTTFRGSSEKGLWWLIVGFGLNALLAVIIIVPLFLWWHRSGMAADWDLGLIWSPFRPGEEQRIFQFGTWTEQLAFRSAYYSLMLAASLLYIPLLLPLLLLGMQLRRIRFFQSVREHVVLWKVFIIIGLSAQALATVAFVPMSTRDAYDLRAAFTVFLGPLSSLALVALAARWPNVVLPFARVGRISVTVYLVQSMLGSLAFYSWGRGRFGLADVRELLIVVAAISTASLLLALFPFKYLDAFVGAKN